jgi:hypothetical protein
LIENIFDAKRFGWTLGGGMDGEESKKSLNELKTTTD